MTLTFVQNPVSRFIASFFVAFTITFGLFWLMQFLIASADRSLDDADYGQVVDFVRVKQEENIERKKPKPEKPPQPDEPPPEPPPPSMDNLNPEAQAMQVSAVNVNPNINLSSSGFGLTPSDGDYLPIVKVTPIYPRRALSRGIEGYVIVEFTVTRQGTTKDHRVVEAKPPGIFDRSALQAAAKFKYKPKIVDGQPIEVPGVQNIIKFEIED